MPQHDPILTHCAALYDTLVQEAVDTFEQAGNRPGQLEYCLNKVEGIAQFGWTIHPGRYADGALENIAVKIGQQLSVLHLHPHEGHIPSLKRKKDTHTRYVLHIATNLPATGGHGRTLYGWLQQDADSCHAVVLTEQSAETVPAFISDAIAASGGEIISLGPIASRLNRAKILRDLTKNWADVVILRTDPRDPVPVCAFSEEHLPPIGLFNHADHTFWLGSAVADTIIDFRTYGSRISKSRRQAQNSHLLPLPIVPFTCPPTRQQARQDLKMDDEMLVITTMGAFYKYIPSETYHFFHTMQHILNRTRNAVLYTIGMTRDQIAPYLDPTLPHDRIVCLGLLDDPTQYLVSSDLYVEGFPYNSLAALLDTIILDVCPVLMYNPTPQLCTAEVLGLENLVSHPADEAEYIKLVTHLLNEPDERTELGRRCGAYIRSHHQGAGWRTQLETIYAYLEQTVHTPRLLQSAACLYETDDINRNRFSYNLYQDIPLVYTAIPLTLSFKHYMSLLYTSIRCGDTKLRMKHIRRWAGRFYRTFLSAR
jgi:hypothetical protein